MEKEYLYQTNDPQRIKEAQKKMPDTSSIEQLADGSLTAIFINELHFSA